MRTILLFMALLICKGASAAIVQTEMNPINGHTYHLLAPSTWTHAETEAEAISVHAHLATIRNQHENDWVWQTFRGADDNSRYLWIGLNDLAQPGSFEWISEEIVAYTNWAGGQPSFTSTGNPNGPAEHWVQMGYQVGPTPSAWNDLQDVDQWAGVAVYGVVEVVPEPSSLLLALVGVILVIGQSGRIRIIGRDSGLPTVGLGGRWPAALLRLTCLGVAIALPTSLGPVAKGEPAPIKTSLPKELVIQTVPVGSPPPKIVGAEKPIAKDLQPFQGIWTFDIYYSDWWPERITNPPLTRAKWRWAIQGNKIQWSGLKIGDVKLSFALNPVKSPKEIDLTFLDGPHKGKRLRGIYQFNPKGAWQICFADPDAKVERPTDVSYSTDEGRTMVVLKRPESQEPAADSPLKAETEETTPP